MIQYAPDLVFIAFGMNDCMNESQDSGGSLERVRSEYKSAIEEMILQVRAQYPDCEFVLVSSFYANPYCHYQSYFDACRDALLELEEAYDGVVCADVTSLQASMLEYKDYLDFSGDNMCHPNDFMARLYAQVCLETIVPGGIDAYVPAEEDPGEEPEPGVPGRPGDVTLDGRVTIRDVAAIRQYMAGALSLTEEQQKAGDVNGDSRITIRDVAAIRLYMAGKLALED